LGWPHSRGPPAEGEGEAREETLMCNTDFDPADVWNETTRRARREHTCGECYLPIPRGRHYVHVSWLYDGRWRTHRMHVECDTLASFIEDEICGGHGTILTGGLGEEIGELNEYDGGRTNSEHPALVALGFEMAGSEEDDDWEPATARDVVEWLWDCIKAEYRPAAEAA
jgi:hypothetical protein